MASTLIVPVVKLGSALEFQVIFTPDTKKDYAEELYPVVRNMIEVTLGEAKLESSDRLPSYAEETIDVIAHGLEVCSMSRRTDFEGAKVIEIAIGTDRCMRLFTWRENQQHT